MFKCLICKKAPPRGIYPRKWKWKTQPGLDNHRCYVDLEKEAEVSRRKEAAIEEAWNQWSALGLTDRKVGDRVLFSGYVVTDPTHSNGSKLRYEEVRRYFSREGKVTAILPPYFMRDVAEALESEAPIEGVRYEVDHGVLGVEFHETRDAAGKRADKNRKEYDEYVRFSSECR